MESLPSKRQGLTSQEALARRQAFGPNALPAQLRVPFWRRFVQQFRSPLIYVLLFAFGVGIAIWVYEGARGMPIESVAIAIILILNAGLGVFQESKSERALNALREMAAPVVWAMRDGSLARIPASELVPGDIVRIEAGDRVPADGDLIGTEGALLDESVLSGESVPVEREPGSQVFSGTLLVRGKSFFEVRRTGEESTMGRLAMMIGDIHADPTPLEQRLKVFGNQIARVILALVLLITIGGLFIDGVGRINHVFLFAVALAVAAIPEGLPAVLTLTLALGVERMAKRKAVVRRLSAVESLGSVTVIATDKTGTLTENRIFVKDLDSPDPDRALRAMVFANDAEDSSGAGDPLELALLEYAQKRGIQVEALRQNHPRHSHRPFDSSSKYMRVTVHDGEERRSYLKGAPEVMLHQSMLAENERRIWEEKSEAYAREGYRVLGLGHRVGEGEHEIEFLGLVLLWDPPRAEVPAAICRAQDAGIRVVMITGDHPATALSVAREIGIHAGRVVIGSEIEAMSPHALLRTVRETNVFARMVPESKLRLIEALKQSGEIVAMTGDGVNDAPALKRSDVGVAMGERGSDVAREVADLVIVDDNFASIVAAIEEGRNIYENIQKFIRFLFSTNLAETLIVVVGAFGAALIGLSEKTGGVLLPLTAIQLLWINIITDGLPALALGLDRDSGVMLQSPRSPRSPLLDRDSLKFILAAGCTLAAIGGALLVVMPHLGFTSEQTRTAIFLQFTLGKLLYAYPARRCGTRGAGRGLNIGLHLSIALSAGLQLSTVLVYPLRELLGLEPVTAGLFGIVATAALLGWIAAEIFSQMCKRQEPKNGRQQMVASGA